MNTLLFLAASKINLDPLPQPAADENAVSTILTIVIGTTAAISLLFITIGGLRYIISQGDAQAVSKAKGTIVFALIGLVIAISAQLIVSFVFRNIK